MMRRFAFILLILAILPSSAFAAERLVVTPSRILLTGRYSEARVLVTSGHRDASGQARLEVADHGVAAVDEDGFVRPRGDGKTTLTASVGGRVATAPIEVHGFAKSGPPRFISDVVPVLTRAGCNTGACHGAGSGKGGFKLSLFGYDPDMDYEAIVLASAGRRIARTQPENSLVLRKPTLGVAHRGGQRFRVGSAEYRILRDWIAGGMPRPESGEPRVTKLQVIPSVRSLAIGQTQRFAVRATL